MSQNVEHRDADHTSPASVGWPQFVVMPEDGFEEVHRGAVEIDYQRNTARHLAGKLGKCVLVFIAVERWMPDGTMQQV